MELGCRASLQVGWRLGLHPFFWGFKSLHGNTLQAATERQQSSCLPAPPPWAAARVGHLLLDTAARHCHTVTVASEFQKCSMYFDLILGLPMGRRRFRCPRRIVNRPE